MPTRAATITRNAVAPTPKSLISSPDTPFSLSLTRLSISVSLGTGLEQSAHGTIKAPHPHPPPTTPSPIPRGRDETKRIGQAYYAAFLLLCASPTPLRLLVPSLVTSARRPLQPLPPSALYASSAFWAFYSIPLNASMIPFLVTIQFRVPSLSFLNFLFNKCYWPGCGSMSHPPSPHLIMPSIYFYVCLNGPFYAPTSVNLVSSLSPTHSSKS
ncbi:hypothetical protein K438DRAFT_1152129 [Mycena galopus ATCC 62051]|nr:hypothetical protein K438DRAFT_1152129 [Mycena galopus ATCC 62051]